MGSITSIAGNGAIYYSDENGLGTAGQLDQPTSVTLDTAGNLYIADIAAERARIRKITADGVISTLVYLNTESRISTSGAPFALAGGLAADVYIAESTRHRIQRLDSQGIFTTIAGNGTSGYSGDGGPAVSAQLRNPGGVAIDPRGNLYIADTANYRVRKVAPNGIITTITGSGSAGFSGDGGPATGAQLEKPRGIAVDAAGNVYIADALRIRKLNPSGVISTITRPGDLAPRAPPRLPAFCFWASV